jgi:hypothetical protein
MIKGMILAIAFLGMTACAHKGAESCGGKHGATAEKKECNGTCKADEKSECKSCHEKAP